MAFWEATSASPAKVHRTWPVIWPRDNAPDPADPDCGAFKQPAACRTGGWTVFVHSQGSCFIFQQEQRLVLPFRSHKKDVQVTSARSAPRRPLQLDVLKLQQWALIGIKESERGHSKPCKPMISWAWLRTNSDFWIIWIVWSRSADRMILSRQWRTCAFLQCARLHHPSSSLLNIIYIILYIIYINILYYIILYYIILYYIVLYYLILYYNILYYISLHYMDYDGMETTLCVMCLRITVYIISVFLIIASLTPSTQLDALAALAAGQRSAQGRSSYMSLAAKQLHLGLLWLVWVDGLRRESTGRPDFEEWSTLSPSNAFRRHSCQGWR